VHGKQGLFPSGYVERIAQPIDTSAPAVSAPKAYKPFGAAYHGVAAPPPPGQGVNGSGLQEAPGTEEKKDKFGKYKSTVSSLNRYSVTLTEPISKYFFFSWRTPLLVVLVSVPVSNHGAIIGVDLLTCFFSLSLGSAIGGGLVRAIF
jgi:hypothetical protein